MPAADRLHTTMETLRVRLARTPASSWGRNILAAWRSVLPASVRPLLQGETGRLLFDHADGHLRITAETPGQERVLGEVPVDDPMLLRELAGRAAVSPSPAWLVLPAGAVLRRSLSLPAAAEARLRDVLVHEIDRQTPFTPDQVSFEGRVTGRDAASQTVKVELLVLPRVRLDQELQAIGPLAAGLAGVDVRDRDGGTLGVNLLAPAQRARGSDPSRRRNLTLLAIAGLALVMALVLVRYNRSEALATLRAEVETANLQVRDVRLARNQLVAKVDAANFLAGRRAASPTMLELLDELTRRIPDDTAVDKLTIDEGRIVMIGQSRAAPALVGLLQDSPLLVGPALTGAVQADPRSGRDRFTLTAQVAGSEGEDGDDSGR
ncbi:PilN domain-containing protein [Arenimonas sp.]|uniref:PilN domain-containing protein n=1 Tax=Arenimonas sp. TaxID=1872635 RepID=UPI0035ADA01E